MKPIILELGMGADVHGRDQTKAAQRAISDAIRHSSLTFFYHYEHPSKMRIQVTLGVPHADDVDREAVIAALPFGQVEVEVVPGGLNDIGMGGAEDITLVTAGVKVWLDTTSHPFEAV